jgi:linoleate 10R-lipoxygenase
MGGEKTDGTNGAQYAPKHNGYQNGATATGGGPLGPKPSGKPPGSKDSFLGTVMKLRQASKRPLPKDRPDGTYREVATRPTLRQDLKSFGISDLKTLKDIVHAKLRGETQQDDKTMIMERTIQLVAGLPNHSKTQEILTNSFIDQLWNSLDHPPLLYMGDQFKWRQPDGSNNNPMMPKLGAAGQPYSRTVKPKTTALGAQPDPEAIFEAVMAREGFRKNPNNVSSILWYWATIIIHDLFWTNLKDGNINDASSYLDLAPLYGGTQEAQNSIRTFKDGMLKPDAFADKRLIANPPGVPILLIMFNRFHNHVAANLAAINEHDRFPKPGPNLGEKEAAAAWKKYDEELFQTARLVTSGLYINITLVDYVRNIINLNRVDSQWTLDPRQEMGIAVGTKEGSESGVGNCVSAEFNLCYRWHSCISEMDDKWIQDFYTELLGENHGEINLDIMRRALGEFEHKVHADPGQRTFGGFVRGPDGKFSDDDLAEAMATAIEQPGGAFGGRNVPRVMKPVEMLGIIRGRRWNLAGLNEFRKHFGLKAYETFEDINSDPAVADGLRNLYQHPDNVELYPGMVAEEAKSPMVPGVGIAPTYTISRVVLSDAVSLVRGDRYYTTDYHPGYLTNFGFKEAEYDLEVNHGCVFYKLFTRAFPNHFQYDSVYAHYPMVIPSENRKILSNLRRVDLFSFDRPSYSNPHVAVTSYGGARQVLSTTDKFRVPQQEGLSFLLDPGSRKTMSRASEVGSAQADQRKRMETLLYKEGWKTDVRTFYSTIAERLLAEKSYKLGGKTQVDIVRDVGNVAHVHFVARMFNLPLKSTEHPKGVFTEHEMYTALAIIFISAFYNLDPVKAFPLRKTAKEVAAKLGGAIETNLKLALALGIRGLFTAKPKDQALASYGVDVAKELGKSGLSAHDIAWHQVLPIAAGMVPTQGQLVAQALDYYLSPGAEAHVQELYHLATQPASDDTDKLLLGYALEGVRLAGGFSLYREVTAADTIIEDDGTQVPVKPGDGILVVAGAEVSRDAVRFPDPDVVNPRRPVDAYIHYKSGPQAVLGTDISDVALIEMFRAVFRKKGLRRVTGPPGLLKKLPSSGGSTVYMTEDWGSVWPFPTTMKVTWDGE